MTTTIKAATPINLTIKDLQQMFGVSHMSIHNWRKDEADPLPFKNEGRNIFFSPTRVLAWAKRNKLVVVKQVGDLKTAAKVKPGPKPRAQAAAKKGSAKAVKLVTPASMRKLRAAAVKRKAARHGAN